MGDVLKIKLVYVDIGQRRINYELADRAAPPKRTKANRAAPPTHQEAGQKGGKKGKGTDKGKGGGKGRGRGRIKKTKKRR